MYVGDDHNGLGGQRVTPPDMGVPKLDACPNCGNTDIYCYSNDLDIIEGDIEKYCDACESTFDLAEAVDG